MAILTQEKRADPAQYAVSASFMKVGKLYHFDFSAYPEVEIGDYILTETRYFGKQMGQIKGFTPHADLGAGYELQQIVRPATPADLLTQQQWEEKSVPALIECREKAAELGGYDAAKFVNAEFNYNGSVLTFFYTCEDGVRINTYRLRSAMYRLYDARIEFRQLGPRDVAKLQAGFGACGIPRCCSTFLTEFSMVSINMAKAQGVSLNPSEITGMCGRLRCCLMYEYEQYVEARRILPKMRKRVGTPHGDGRVIEVHPLQDAVTVRVNDENFLVEREDLHPIDEYDALKRAAASPCSKNAEGGCDCGAKRPRGSAEQLMDEMGVSEPSASSADNDADATEPPDSEQAQDRKTASRSKRQNRSQKSGSRSGRRSSKKRRKDKRNKRGKPHSDDT